MVSSERTGPLWMARGQCQVGERGESCRWCKDSLCQEERGEGLQGVGRRPGSARGPRVRTRQWAEVGTGARSTSRGWGLPPRGARAGAWERLRCRSRRAGNREGGQGKRTTASRGIPGPDPGKLLGWEREGLGRWSSQLPARRGFAAARGPGRLVSRPPACAPRQPGAPRGPCSPPAAAAAGVEKAAASVGVRTC